MALTEDVRARQRKVIAQTEPYQQNSIVGQSIKRSNSYKTNIRSKEAWKRIEFSVSHAEATKGFRWMPWRQVPKKDVGHCEKPRGTVNR